MLEIGGGGEREVRGAELRQHIGPLLELQPWPDATLMHHWYPDCGALV